MLLHHPTNHRPLCTSSHIIRIRVSVCVVVTGQPLFKLEHASLASWWRRPFLSNSYPPSHCIIHQKSPITINPSQVKTRASFACLTRYTINNRWTCTAIYFQPVIGCLLTVVNIHLPLCPSPHGSHHQSIAYCTTINALLMLLLLWSGSRLLCRS